MLIHLHAYTCLFIEHPGEMPFATEKDEFILKIHYRSGVQRESGESSYSLHRAFQERIPCLCSFLQDL